MEAGAQYALHDNEATSLWAARVRLTPELLDKLRSDPQQVLLKLNVAGSDGVSKTRNSSKKTSLLTVKRAGMGTEETVEQYELLSFPEDPGINHLCSFQRDNAGYNVHKTGAIHQKLLVQRLLDATEKDRIKDKHARSVLASKSRSSKLIETEPEAPAKRQRTMMRMTKVPTTRLSTGTSAWSKVTGRKRKLVLPSALSKEDAQETRKRIEKGFEVESVAATEGKTAHNGDEAESDQFPAVIVSAATAAAARDAEFHDLFSSDSDDNAEPAEKKRRGKKKAAKESHAGISLCTVATNEDAADDKNGGDASRDGKVFDTTEQDALIDATAQPKMSSIDYDGTSRSTDEGGDAKSKFSEKTAGVHLLPPIKPSTSGVEVKRARVRSTLLPDRVKISGLPDLSFFPVTVLQICQRLAKHHGRSVILDDSDYNSFVDMHEQFRQDWEVLDKAYSIEMIKTEGLHLQQEFATTDAARGQLEDKIQASTNKKAGLLFVQDSMSSIQKILRSIQVSIRNFDLKHGTCCELKGKISTNEK
ncbi:hypothetical protein PHYBOEH_008887 [Phytophthora boehmeriae]|uniref:Uncharacterized protein n=1 Tax=Phytophthora boehmeriae TaxID=109152 RepID=A0A8T1VY15_9STRA|nr:hypothetical protein PHYBOEH_008887 [Phytophthora boehmeriae]